MTDAPAARGFALVFGIIYVAVGVVGFFVTGFDGWLANTDERLIVFDLNGFHNLIHLSIGAFLIVAARFPAADSTRGVNLGVGVFLLIAAFAGFAEPTALEVISIDSRLAADNFLHLGSGLLALVFGFSRVAAATTSKA